MRFYTNVYQRFNEMLVRGYENGKQFSYREPFAPTFYVPSKKESKWKTLDGENVEPIKPGKISDCKEFVEKYKDCLLYTSPSPRDYAASRMPSSA